jgi:hypothetical protein
VHRRVRKTRNPPFHLRSEGFSPIAIYWKNLTLTGGLSLRQSLLGLIALTILAIPVAGALGRQISMFIGSVSAGLIGFMVIMGPIVIKDDLRIDMQYAPLLKSYPIPGWGIVLGEVLGPVTSLTIRLWILVLLSVCFLPAMGTHAWKTLPKVFVGLGAAILLPCLGFIGILVQNAAVLILPGWVKPGRERSLGVEAMGQRLIAGIATVLSLLIASVPCALLFFAVWLAGNWLIGSAIIPIASLVAASGLLIEAGLGVLWLGRYFDRLDPSSLTSES